MIKDFHVTDVTHHRNGIGGRPFASVRFSFDNEGTFHPNMVAVMPYADEDVGHGTECYVLDLNDPTSNWRGDNFAAQVRKAVEQREEDFKKGLAVARR